MQISGERFVLCSEGVFYERAMRSGGPTRYEYEIFDTMPSPEECRVALESSQEVIEQSRKLGITYAEPHVVKENLHTRKLFNWQLSSWHTVEVIPVPTDS